MLWKKMKKEVILSIQGRQAYQDQEPDVIELVTEGTLEYRGWQYLGLRRYDLGGMAPVIQPEHQVVPDVPAEKVNGILTHELEE